MKKLLLTGFEPFLNYSLNPTEEIARALDGETINNYTIVAKVLPVDYNKSGDQLVSLIEEVRPDSVLSLGLAAGRYKVTPERIAINCNESKEEDNEGNQPEGDLIDAEGADGLFSSLPIRTFVEVLNEKEYPAEVSNTAGTYLCNHVMYRGLNHFKKKNMEIPSGFIHLPASHDLAVQHGNLPSWSQEDLTSAVKEIILSL
ncbi:pyroglutamyl-peptidase I [Halobacillus litoralis]|uniref:Pyroglutamyl-peptidase I n=1 Tax=Halobacillus litoralis TaxID=45668 RepID=A0A845F7S7_9BACI|nr:pyroglutamyl-peptidase I [Halobacillus litoralis]MYL69949.1 pyroglutamyl-peptidase I [Halobacillus litoralis]